MSHSLGPISVIRKTGNEPFHQNGQPLEFDVLSFWQWSASDLLSNATRGILAEYLVSRALNDSKEARADWDAFDVRMHNGARIEVKSSAFIQSWYQKKLSNISFSISSTQAWRADTNSFDNDRKRQADVYVFSLLNHKDQETIDPLNLDQWKFFVVSTNHLNAELGEQKTVGLNRLRKIGAKEVEYNALKKVVDQALEQRSV